MVTLSVFGEKMRNIFRDVNIERRHRVLFFLDNLLHMMFFRKL